MPLGQIHPNLLFEVTFRHFLTLRFSYNLVIFEIFLPISPKVKENKGLNHHEFFKNPVRFLDIKNASVYSARRFYSYQKLYNKEKKLLDFSAVVILHYFSKIFVTSVNL